MKMKNLTMIAIMLLMVLTASGTYAQNYKQPVPSIDANGKVIDAKGKHIGWVTSEGIIKDAAGKKLLTLTIRALQLMPQREKTGKGIEKRYISVSCPKRCQ